MVGTFGILLAALVAPGANASLNARLDPVLATATAGGFAGELLVGDASGRVLYQRAAGIADRERGTRHRPGQLWRWASVSKQVTAALAMAEVDAGRLSLDDTVGKFLPAYAAAGRDPVTVRQLLQHMSGLPNPTPEGAEGGDTIPPFYARTGGDVGGARDALGFCAGPRRAKPGESFAYNNCDFIVLGAILERVTGRSLPELVRSRLVRPYRMRSLQVARAGRPGVRGYDEVGGGELPYNLATFGPGGALVGTGRDLLKFNGALLGRRLVTPASTEIMWKGEPKLGFAALGAWSFPATLKGCTGSVPLVERRGAIGGVQVRNVLAPTLGRSVVVFTNSAKTEFGEIWQGKGLSYDLLSAALCGSSA